MKPLVHAWKAANISCNADTSTFLCLPDVHVHNKGKIDSNLCDTCVQLEEQSAQAPL